MEDHLRNKGRLQREWEALCRYEAEPSARDAALQPQCATLNRPGAPLPYDHSRVVLNHLANAEGLDYVNASTIVRESGNCLWHEIVYLNFTFRPIMIHAHRHMLLLRVLSQRLWHTFGK